MSRPLAALLVLLPCLLAADLVSARSLYDRGRFRLAATQYRELVESDPEAAPAARLGLGKSQAAMDRCALALEHLTLARSTSVWDAEGAHAEAKCWQRLGDRSSAIAALEDAVVLDPESASTWYSLAKLRGEAGDHEGSAQAAEDLARLEDGATLALVARAWSALQQGGDVELALWQLERHLAAEPSATGEVSLALIDALYWIELDHPGRAGRDLADWASRYPRQLPLVVYRAEAIRRIGQPDAALGILSRKGVQRTDYAVTRAIQARAEVDLGRMDEAAATLEAAFDQHDPELIASAWYLAYARGELALARELAATWAADRGRDPAELHLLVPLPLRP